MGCTCMYVCEGQRWSCLGQARVGAVPQGWWLTTAMAATMCCCWHPLSCVLYHPCLVERSVPLPSPSPLLSTLTWTQRYLGPDPLLVVLPWWLLASPSRSGEGHSGERWMEVVCLKDIILRFGVINCPFCYSTLEETVSLIFLIWSPTQSWLWHFERNAINDT